MKNMIKIAMSAALFFLVACSQADKQEETGNKTVRKEAVTSKPAQTEQAAVDSAADDNAGKPAAIPAKKIMFFMNPNGRPCQMQDDVIKGILHSIAGKANVQYVKTTIPSDRETFYRFGVRSLPQLVIVNDDGSEHKRFSPGIHQAEEIIEGLE